MLPRVAARAWRAPTAKFLRPCTASIARPNQPVLSHTYFYSDKRSTRTALDSNTTPKSQPGSRPEASDPSNPVPRPTTDSESANDAYEGPHDPAANTEPSGPLPDLRFGIPASLDAADASAQSTSKSESQGRRETYREQDYKASDYETSNDRKRAKLANYMYGVLGTVTVVGSLYFGRTWGEDEPVPRDLDRERLTGWSPSTVWTRIKARSLGSVSYWTEPLDETFLPPQDLGPEGQTRPTLVLSLQDLLVHSVWDREHGWRMAKRPGVDAFLQFLYTYYEIVLFTTVSQNFAEPSWKKLDPLGMMMPCFGENTTFENGKTIKDLSRLGRPLNKVIAIDTKEDRIPHQSENVIILPKWHGDPKADNAGDLFALIPFLEYAAVSSKDMPKALATFKNNTNGLSVAQEFSKREMALREKAKTDFKARLAVQRIDEMRANGRLQYNQIVAQSENAYKEVEAFQRANEQMQKEASAEMSASLKSKLDIRSWFGSKPAEDSATPKPAGN